MCVPYFAAHRRSPPRLPLLAQVQACASDIVAPPPYDWIQMMPENYQFLISLLSSNTTASKRQTAKSCCVAAGAVQPLAAVTGATC